MVEDLGHLYMLVAYFQDLQKRGISFKFYQQNEHDSGPEDELDFDTSAIVTKPTTRQKSPPPHRPSEQPHTDQLNKVTDKALTPLTAETSQATPATSAVPLRIISPTADTSITTAPDPPRADQLNKATEQLPKPLTAETTNAAPTTSAVPPQNVGPSANTPIITAAKPSEPDVEKPPGALPTEASTAITPAVSNKKKRKRAVHTEPRPVRNLRPRGKPQVADPTPAEPQKKRQKVRANSWRLNADGVEVPYYPTSDYVGNKEDAGPSMSDEHSLKSVPALNTDSHFV